MSRSILLLASLVSPLTGCAARGLGNSQYGCKGMPEGVRCLSTLEVYAATEHADAVHSTGAQGEPHSSISPDVSDPRVPHGGPDSPTVVLLPKADATVPLRVPAQVMRIWFAPWEDASGDLHVGLVSFTEIVPRRWAIGDPYSPDDALLAPLQAEPLQ